MHEAVDCDHGQGSRGETPLHELQGIRLGTDAHLPIVSA